MEKSDSVLKWVLLCRNEFDLSSCLHDEQKQLMPLPHGTVFEEAQLDNKAVWLFFLALSLVYRSVVKSEQK